MKAEAESTISEGDAPAAKDRVATRDWTALASELDNHGCAVLEGLLTPRECGALAALYPHERHFRSHVDMARHGFGRGEYRYFRYPLPDLVAALRERSTLVWRRSPMPGTNGCASTRAIRPLMPTS